MKPYEYYRGAGEYPKKPVKPQYPLKDTAYQMREYAAHLEGYEQEMEVYTELIKQYRERQENLNEEFRVDVLEEYGLTEHPKADKVYTMAWDHGHSSGYYEVAQWVSELAELVL